MSSATSTAQAALGQPDGWIFGYMTSTRFGSTNSGNGSMGDPGHADFRQWLRVELERERLERALAASEAGEAQAIYLSELEATALMMLALDAERHLESDDATAEFAHYLAGALHDRIDAATLDDPNDGLAT